jgi:hypothetical protein
MAPPACDDERLETVLQVLRRSVCPADNGCADCCSAVHGAWRGVPAKFPSGGVVLVVGGVTLVVGGGRTVMLIVIMLGGKLGMELSVIVIESVIMDPTWALAGIVKE